MKNNIKVGDEFTINAVSLEEFSREYCDCTVCKVYTATGVGAKVDGFDHDVSFLDDVNDTVCGSFRHMTKV